jgi:uncharacterized protein (DUF2141 family)
VTNALRLGVAVLVAVGTAAGAQEREKAHLTVVIDGLRNTEGRVHVSLYDREDGFPRDEQAILRTESVAPVSTRVVVEFTNLDYGEYAVAVLHDEDLSGGMTYQSFRRPKEGYCFSNNLRPKIRAPKWKKARFPLDRESVRLTLRMIYWGGSS